MQEFYDSLNYALESGPYFDLNEDSTYVHAMISRTRFKGFIERYLH